MAASRTSCPLCVEYKPRTKSELQPIKFHECFVSQGDKLIGFKEATLDYVDSHYQDIEKKTYKVPAAFSYHQDAKLDFVPDAKLDDFYKNNEGKKVTGKRTPHEILVDRRQKEAVERVAVAIHSLGKKRGMAMFVLSEFNFKSFLAHSVKKDEDESTLKKVEFKEIYDLPGDHDILVISKMKGITAVQVKSVTASSKPKTKRQQLQGAMKQIKKDEHAIRTMNRDLDFIDSLPTLGIVAVPNLSDEDLDAVSVCESHKKMILTGNHLRDEGCFEEWWMQQQQLLDKGPRGDVMSLKDYRELCGRYVGLASAAVKYRTLSDAISRLGSKISVMLLTPEQNDVLSAERRLNILLGDYGTGKSLVIIRMADKLSTECADIVYVISFSTVSSGSGKIQKEKDNSVHLLQQFSTNKDKENLKMRSLYDHLTEIESWEGSEYAKQQFQYPLQLTADFLCDIMRITLEMHPRQVVHFLFDEVPICIGKSERQGEWRKFETFCQENSEMTVWMSIAAYSYALKKDEDYSHLYEHLPTSFAKNVFRECMRMCRNGFRLVQAVREFKGDGLFAIAECGNAIDGPIPIWYELTSCTCSETHSSLSCRCAGERLKIPLHSILEDVSGTHLKEIAVILHDTSTAMTRYLARSVEEACASLSVPVNFRVSSVAQRSPDLEVGHCSDDSRAGGITLVDYWSYKGSEDKVVIYIDPYGGPLVWNIESRWHGYQDVAGAFSRGLAQIFYVTWPEGEQRQFCLDLADNLEESAPSEAEDPAGRHFKLGVAQAIRNGRKGHEWEGRNFADYLVEKRVITRHNATVS